MPKRIKIEDAADGMVLSSGVEDKAGRPILKAGDVIKSSFIPRLIKWGIEEIVVQAGDDARKEEGKAEIKVNSGAVDKLLKLKFTGHKIDSHMQIVRDSVRKFLVAERLDF